MGDEIDDVIQGILERARQRKELLSEMISKKSDTPLQLFETVDQEPKAKWSGIEESTKTTLDESTNDKLVVNIGTDVDTLRVTDLQNDNSTKILLNGEQSSDVASKPIEPHITAQFSSLTEALEAKYPAKSHITVLGTGFVRSQKKSSKEEINFLEPEDNCKTFFAKNKENLKVDVSPIEVTPVPPETFHEVPKTITQRGRVALASLASKYLELDSESSKETHGKKLHSQTDLTERKGLALLVSKDSEIVKQYAKESENAKCNSKTSMAKDATAPIKKWNVTSASMTRNLHASSSVNSITTTSTPGSNVSVVNTVPSRISVAMTARMFEESAKADATVAQTTSGTSITKARAAFFNNLATGSVPIKSSSKVSPINLQKSSGNVSIVKAGVNASYNVTASLMSSNMKLNSAPTITSDQETDSSIVPPTLSVFTSPCNPTYTSSSKLDFIAKPSPTSATLVSNSLVPLEEETCIEMTPKSKLIRRDSWEDSKTSIDYKDSNEDIGKQSYNLLQSGNDIKGNKDIKLNDEEEVDVETNEEEGEEEEEEEEEESDVINDEDFGNISSTDCQSSEKNEVKEVLKGGSVNQIGLSHEFHIMKDITNENVTTNNGVTDLTVYDGEQNFGKSTDTVEQAEVSMRKTRKRSGSFQKPRGYISLYEYRQLQQSRPKSQPPAKPRRTEKTRNDENVPAEQKEQVRSPCPGVVMRKKNLYPDLSNDVITSSSHISTSVGLKTTQERIEELQNLINKELNIIQQTSNALNKCCHDQSLFAGSPEAVECHKLLLMSCKRREVYIIEMQKLKALNQPFPSPRTRGPMGRLTISEIRLPMKSDFMNKLGTSEDNTAHYFILVIRHDDLVLFSQMVSTHEGQLSKKHHHHRCDYLEFPNLISLNNVYQDFKIDVEIFGMSITRTTNQPGTPKKTPRKNLTPKSSRRLESPAGPMSFHTTNFVHLAMLTLDKKRISSEMFTLDRVPRSSPLQSCMFMNIRCIMENVIHKKDFLTMFEDVSGLGAWHRRWFSLKNGSLSYWKYPEDELKKEPMGVIDLRNCLKNLHVKKVTREVCARPNTFEIEVSRPQRKGDRNTLIQTCDELADIIRIKHWLSADTKEDCESWCNALNEALVNVRAWHSDARPTSQR